MIRTDPQFDVICSSCLAPSYQREVICIAPERKPIKVTYYTHTHCEQLEHAKALQRLDTFVTAMNSLLAKANLITPELPFGKILDIAASPVNPSACGIRTHFIPIITVKAFGIEEEIECEPVKLAGLTAQNLIDQIISAATNASLQLKHLYETGTF